MTRSIFLILVCIAPVGLRGSGRPAGADRNKLIDTRLDVRFDYKKHYLYGSERVSLRPDQLAADSLYLDAKGMLFDEVSLVGLEAGRERRLPLQYGYDGAVLRIRLDRVYQPGEHYSVYLKYTARPDELPGAEKGGGLQGLYFINSDGADPKKPVEIWTQGEPNGSSVWFPTIDEPGQHTTQQISMTVPEKYTTLSNGKLVGQRSGGDGMRTDTWKMDEPHAPYLFMMAVGDFKVYRDKWRDVEVNYYLEERYAPYAKQLFGKTPEMIEVFSRKLGVPYPWSKYSEVVVRDYAEGAMENTTASLFGESFQRTSRQLMDEDYSQRESTIAHELFHHWFGDYVTCKDWDNLAVNESLGCFGETLWAWQKYGADDGDAHIYECLQQYLYGEGADKKSVIRSDYTGFDELLDVVTYQKGACILNMLRTYLGDEPFYGGLRRYLVQHAHRNTDMRDLEAAFEGASGKDLKWFFDQWFYRPGHPELRIGYRWDGESGTQYIFLEQTQQGEPYLLPMAVDLYTGGGKRRYAVFMRGKRDTLAFRVDSRPDLVNVDADKGLVGKKEDGKDIHALASQYYLAGKFADRSEAIRALGDKQDSAEAARLILDALKDKYYGLRIYAIKCLKLDDPAIAKVAVPVLRDIGLHDVRSLVRAEAISKLGVLKDPVLLGLFEEALGDSSYLVEASALHGIAGIDAARALKSAKLLEKDNEGPLTVELVNLYVSAGSEEQLPFVSRALDQGSVESRFDIAKGCTILLARVNNTAAVTANVEKVKDLAVEFKRFGADKYAIKWLVALKKKKQDQVQEAKEELRQQLTVQVDCIDRSIAEIQNAKGR